MKAPRSKLVVFSVAALLSTSACGPLTLQGNEATEGGGEVVGVVDNLDPADPNDEAPDALDGAGPSSNVLLASDAGAQPGDKSTLSCAAGLATGRYIRCDEQEMIHYYKEATTGSWVQNYSTTGYRGGGVALPSVPTRATLNPSGGDDTDAIQGAIDAVSARQPDGNGWRGRIVLAPGTFSVSRTLKVTAGGVVLEGTASVGTEATTLRLTGSATTLLTVAGSGGAKPTGTTYQITSLPVPAGSKAVQLNSTDGLRVGDAVQVLSYRNLSWIGMMWGGSYPPVRNGAKQTAWGSSMSVPMSRTIVAITGSSVSLDAPLGDTLPASNYAATQGATLRKEDDGKFLGEFGLGHIKLQGRYVGGTLGSTQLTGVSLNGVQNSWLDDIATVDFGFSAVSLGGNTRNITVQDMRMARTGIQDGGAKPFDINIYGQKILIQGCSSKGDKTFYATHNTASCVGPNVVQNYRVQGKGTFEPHQRWSPGILYDNVYIPAGGIALKDRGGAGSGHGWGTGFSVVYNSLAGTSSTDKAGMDALPGFTLDQPPQAVNLGMGLVGPDRSVKKNAKLFDSPSKPIGPPSLWPHQLWQRLGPNALRTVVGPWHVTTADGKACLLAAAAEVGSKLAVGDCDKAGQRALFDVTSRGWLRLGDSGLCVDALNRKAGTQLVLKGCNDSAAQRWTIPSRGGFVTVVRLEGNAAGSAGCVVVDGGKAAVGACDEAHGGWRMLVTHLAR